MTTISKDIIEIAYKKAKKDPAYQFAAIELLKSIIENEKDPLFHEELTKVEVLLGTLEKQGAVTAVKRFLFKGDVATYSQKYYVFLDLHNKQLLDILQLEDPDTSKAQIEIELITRQTIAAEIQAKEAVKQSDIAIDSLKTTRFHGKVSRFISIISVLIAIVALIVANCKT